MGKSKWLTLVFATAFAASASLIAPATNAVEFDSCLTLWNKCGNGDSKACVQFRKFCAECEQDPYNCPY